MAPSASEFRPLGWNGIYAQLPESWEVIVKGNNHLIIEHNFSPILEFRWQVIGKSTTEEKQQNHIFSQLKKETGRTPCLADTPVFLNNLHPRYTVSPFTLDNELPLAGSILNCTRSNTLVLFHFFKSTIGWVDQMKSFFNSFTCFSDERRNDHWSIQDITFKLHENLILDSFSFSFGLARLHFKSKLTDVTMYRLTNGSKHLKKQSLKELFAKFTGDIQEIHYGANSNTLILKNEPTLITRLMGKIKRNKLYCWGKFQYFPHHDKILGIHMESRYPIPQEHILFIDQGYGFIQ